MNVTPIRKVQVGPTCDECIIGVYDHCGVWARCAGGWGEAIVPEFHEELGRQKPGPNCPTIGTPVPLVGGDA